VLSACSTGRNAQDEADTVQPSNLARTFLQHGAREVIASRWNADTNAASVFMQLYYRHLARDGDSGRAMRDAQREMAQQPRFQHPYYWAVFARFI
jgi:CHAT domain-containing protein